MARVSVPEKMAKKLYEKNANSCCVCKRTGIGLNLHHIDGDNSNTVEDNLAVLCVNEHDAYHRPSKYPSLNHLDLYADKISAYKIEWENFVQECRKEEPKVLAVINAFGTYENIVGMKIVFQWENGKIIFERCFQQLDGDLNYWTDMALAEAVRFGKNIKVVLIDKPLKIDFCPNHYVALSQTLDAPAAKKILTNDWKEKSVATVYINPDQASLAILVFYNNDVVYSIHMHRCGNIIKYIDYKGTKSTKVKLLKVRKQVNAYILQIIKKWDVGMVFYGTGDPDNPTLIRECKLPIIWECFGK